MRWYVLARRQLAGDLVARFLSGTGGIAGGLDVTLTVAGGCRTYITRAIMTNEAKLGLIGAGERGAPHTEPQECLLSLPASTIDQTTAGLESNFRTGVFRYPGPDLGEPVPRALVEGYVRMWKHLVEVESE